MRKILNFGKGVTMIKYILIATALIFSTHAFAVDMPKCSEGMVWDADLGVCVESTTVPSNKGDVKEMKTDVKTDVNMDKVMDDSSGK